MSASAGRVATHELAATVMPFIIRGVSLLGMASPEQAWVMRDNSWRLMLASRWKPRRLESHFAGGNDTGRRLPEVFNGVLSGQNVTSHVKIG